MPTTVVTREAGATAKTAGVLYIPPEAEVPVSGTESGFAAAGLDPAFMADLISACLAHERCGTHLYRSVAARTLDPERRERYEHFGTETLEHVRLLEELAVASGGDPFYVSPSARATERAGASLVESTFMLEGSVDPETAELAMLEAVLLAEEKDRGNWELLALLATQMAPGELQTQLATVTAEVLAQEDEHYSWARDTRTRVLFSLATGGAEPPAEAMARMAGAAGATRRGTARRAAGDGADGGGGADDLTALSRDELYAAAQELDIPGRSGMNKRELADAIAAEQEGPR